MEKEYRSAISVGPGSHIREEIEARGWSVEEFADRLCMSAKHVSELLNDKKPVTVETAKMLSEVFGTSAQFWMNLNTNFVLSKDSGAEKVKEVELRAVIYSIMPVSDMVKKGWIQRPKSARELFDCIGKIWDTDNVEDIQKRIQEYPLAAFKKSENGNFSHNYSQTWLRIAEKLVSSTMVPAYDCKAFEILCGKAHEYTLKEKGVEEFIIEMNKAGVKFLVLPHFIKTYIDGAAFTAGSNPVIVYTGRHNRFDNFWFTLMHEAGHIIRHLKKGKEVFVDDLDKVEGVKEVEANKYSLDKLRIGEILDKFDAERPNRVSWITEVSASMKISPAIIVGALQFAKKITYRSKMLNEIKKPVLNEIPERFKLNVKALCN